MNIYWGDLHNHNELGYGKGSPERAFALARNSMDVYAFTPHTWWPDLPENDPRVKDHHLKGFGIVKHNWGRIKKLVQDNYAAGEFVTLLGWEWHSRQWGDYCMYFPDADGEFVYAADLDELAAYARQHEALLIPHHVGYERGCRGINWDTFPEAVSPLVEVFSEHGNSFDPVSHKGMYSHSMGGIEYSQSALRQLQLGRQFGVVASTDDHHGYPGGYGYGLAAFLADRLDRASIIDAIRRRHTYAVTGDRIGLDFSVNGSVMGDTVPCAGAPEISFRVQGRDRLRLIEVLKNGRPFRCFTTVDFQNPANLEKNPERLLRLEWGWDHLASKEITEWRLEICAESCGFSDIQPCFCGGGGSVTALNLLEEATSAKLRISSFTSRANALPYCALTCRVSGGAQAALSVQITGNNGGCAFAKDGRVTLAQLEDASVNLAVLNRFSSPRLKLNALIDRQASDFKTCFTDPEACAGDSYLLKVLQENGHMAWSSPIWIA